MLNVGFEPTTRAHKIRTLQTELIEQIMTIVGFEPTRTNTPDLKSGPLDLSGK